MSLVYIVGLYAFVFLPHTQASDVGEAHSLVPDTVRSTTKLCWFILFFPHNISLERLDENNETLQSRGMGKRAAFLPYYTINTVG
jgi:hypothetical protein